MRTVILWGALLIADSTGMGTLNHHAPILVVALVVCMFMDIAEFCTYLYHKLKED
jgi:hypothetical protein